MSIVQKCRIMPVCRIFIFSVGEIFPKIKQLTLYSNKLNFLHKDFNTMQSLSVLDLQDNKITRIDSLMGLSALKVLNLAHNEIEYQY